MTTTSTRKSRKRPAKVNPDAPLVGYVRVSTTGQAASGVGIDAQREAIRQASASMGLDVAQVFEDAGRSGASMKHREGLQAALQEIAEGRASGLISPKVDRLGRNLIDVMTLVEKARSEGWRLIVLDLGGADLTTPAGEMTVTALAMAARFEWRRISERQKEKHAQLRRQGRRRGHDQAPRELADRIRAMRASGTTWQAIADTLHAEGIPTPQGGAQWWPSTVRSVAETRRLELEAQGVLAAA